MSAILGPGALQEAPVEDIESLLADGTSALFGEGDLLASRRRFEAAYRAAEQAGDTVAMAVAALGLSGLFWVNEHRSAVDGAQLQARLRHALSLVDPQSAIGVQLRSRLAAETDYGDGGHSAILALLDEARRCDDPVVRVEVLGLAHDCLLGPDHGELRRALALELVHESFATHRRSDLLVGMLWQTVDLFLDGDPHAERRLGELRDLLTRGDHLAIGYLVNVIGVMLTLRGGHFDLAETRARACAERGLAVGDIDARAWYGAQIVAIRWYQGRMAGLLPMLNELVHSPTLTAADDWLYAALAVAAARAGDRRKAAGALARLGGGNNFADLPRSGNWLVTMNGIVEAAYLLEDAETAARAYELLSPFAHLPMVVSIGVACFGSVQHALGVASLTTGDVDRAVQHLRAALQQNLALGHWPAVVTSRTRYAEALSRRGHPADAAAAQRELATAASEAAALGMPAPDSALQPADMELTCRRQGRNWRIDTGSRSVLVEHSVGMFHLATLIANPGKEILATDLVAGLETLSSAAERAGSSEQPVLDRTAARDYRLRLARLRAEIDDMESRDNQDGAAGARIERDWLMAELAGAAGFGGRIRRFPDSGERARIAAGKAIRRALARIADVDAQIGEHLRSTVHTGLRCSYRPS